MDTYWVSWVLLVWFALEALLFAILPQQALKLLQNISPRELRVVGIIQVLIVGVLVYFMARLFGGGG